MSSVLRSSPEIAGVPGFAKALALWETTNERLRDLAARQALPLSTALIERDEAFVRLEDHTLKVAGQVLHYASENGLRTLANLVRIRPSAFRVLGPDQRVQLAWRVHDTVEPLVAQLGDYGLDAQELAAFKTTIESAEAVATAPRDATVNRRAATFALRDAFRAVDRVIANHLTPLLRPLKRAHPEFYERYLGALEIVDRGGPHSSAGDEARAPATPAATAAPAESTQPKAA